MINIRQAKNEDIPVLVELYNIVSDIHRSYHPIYLEIDNPGMIVVPNNYINNFQGVGFVAEIEGKVVGFVGASYKYLPKTFKTKFTLHLTNIVVFPEYRNKGIATALLKKLIEWAKERKIKYVTLDVAVQNEEAIKLYNNFGFKNISTNMIINTE